MAQLNSNPNLMISVSGIRGRIPEGLFLENSLNFINSFIETLNPKSVIIGRDSRPSGIFLENFVTGILLSKGIRAVNLGLVPTPTVKSVVKETNSSGGIMISASHNPIDWNAFKLIGKNGFFFGPSQMEIFKEHSVRMDFRPPLFNPKAKVLSDPAYIRLHIESVLKRVNVPKIRKKKFRVFLDAVNGGGSKVVPMLLEELGCKVYPLYCEGEGGFPREPEPTPKALEKTAKQMRKTDAQIGFALDPDADRLVLLTPERGCISEEYTLPLSLLSVLPGNRNTVVTNLSSSFITEKVASEFGKIVLRSKVGEANVVAEMLNARSMFGGEGNGGVIDPEISSFGRDSLAGIAHILNVLAEKNQSIDSLLDEMPEIHMEKTSYSVKDRNLSEILLKFKTSFPSKKIDERDGLWMDLGGKWIHLRASNTEPIIRLIGEAETERDLKEMMKRSSQVIAGE
ncbi:MAG TPA: phosphoglucosamine mutase [Leptospiraceae bacterium]|nr:phosphoglucosamine mutase [Leptospiraceae bacterium]HMY69825.1 phosphoglucosamine mutase [Leptospiraceae bacterium]HNF15436.1 phosphoglucosamine mutase [Leptospiraceae bacterium]HNF23498.1 phosphoglucosamine mutase [Leptospiraceae bacterium]HNM01718.1 phosphoglucosamine mutase [Leptospiraceae bacterium]